MRELESVQGRETRPTFLSLDHRVSQLVLRLLLVFLSVSVLFVAQTLRNLVAQILREVLQQHFHHAGVVVLRQAELSPTERERELKKRCPPSYVNRVPVDLHGQSRFAFHLLRKEKSSDQRVQLGTLEENRFADHLVLSVQFHSTGENVLQTDGLLLDEEPRRVVLEARLQRQPTEIEKESFVREGVRRDDDRRGVEGDVQMHFERLFLQLLHLDVGGVRLARGQIQSRFGDVQRVEKALRERRERERDRRQAGRDSTSRAPMCL